MILTNFSFFYKFSLQPRLLQGKEIIYCHVAYNSNILETAHIATDCELYK